MEWSLDWFLYTFSYAVVVAARFLTILSIVFGLRDLVERRLRTTTLGVMIGAAVAIVLTFALRFAVKLLA